MTSCRILTTLLVSLGLVAPATTFAQVGELEEITVTARKVGESIQDIPLSITAFSAEQIQEQQIVGIEDIGQFTPGLHISNRTGARADPSLRFRGMDPPSAERNKQLASGFVDGVYIPGQTHWVSMNDIERVEVVKGPQSAFFGRATFSGAVNFITKTPGNDWRGDVQLIAGDNSRTDLWLSAEGPIVEDKLAFRVSGRLYEYDGGWENDFPGSDNLGAQETSAASITLFWTPTENISVKYRSVYSEDRDGHGPSFLLKGESNNCGPFGTGTDTYYCGTLSRDLISNGIAIDTSDPPDTSAKTEMGLERFTDFHSLDINVDIGEYTITSLTGLYNEDSKDLRELLTDEFLVYTAWEDKAFSQELRLTSPQEERLRWMIGGYYLDLNYTKNGEAGFGCPGTGPFCFGQQRGNFAIFGINPTGSNDFENTAVFGSLSYDITEQVTVSLELRRAEEDLSTTRIYIQEEMPINGVNQPRGAGPGVSPTASFSSTTPRLIVDYKPNENWTLYGSYAEGNNPGGFNDEVIQLEATVALPNFQMLQPGVGYDYKEAELKQYEFGVKHSLVNGRGFVNGAIYFVDWTNQVFRGFIAGIDSNGDGIFRGPGTPDRDFIGGQVDYNANGNSEILGFELAANYILSDNWLVSFGYNFNDTDIGDYQDAILLRVFGDADGRGKEIARSPKHAATFSLDFNMPAAAWGGGGEWFARWDTWYQSETYNWVLNLAETESAALHNIRGGWRNDRYSVTGWIENATDDDSVLASARTTGSFLTQTLGNILSLPEPRSYGVTFTARFGE